MMERRHHLYLSMGIFLLLSNGINGQENVENAQIGVINQLTNTVNELKAQFQDFQTSVENQLAQKDQMIDQLTVTVNEIKAQLQCQEGKKSDFCNVCADGYEKTEAGECVKARNPKILVVGGGPGVEMKTELWPGSSKNQCNLTDFPMAVSGAVGFNIAQGPVICGGYVTTSRPTMITTTTTGAAATTASTSLMENRCFILKHRHWMPFFNMTTTRWRASATEINNDQTLIIGGRDENWNYLKTTELISSRGTEKGKDFPVTIQDHCTFKINATHAMVTGGHQGGSSYSADAWYVDLSTTTFTPGPTMNVRRSSHGCSIVHLGTKTYGVVSGGYGHGRYLHSTEWIDLDQESPRWTEGPKLPKAWMGSTFVGTPTQGTYAMGGWDRDIYTEEDHKRRSEVLQLDCPGDQIQSCRWKELDKKMEFARIYHMALALPESNDICN